MRLQQQQHQLWQVVCLGILSLSLSLCLSVSLFLSPEREGDRRMDVLVSQAVASIATLA